MGRLVTPVLAYYSCAEGGLKNLEGVQRAQAEESVWLGGELPDCTETEPRLRFFCGGRMQHLRASEVSSATDEKQKVETKTSGKNEPKARRPNPVALEVPVSVTGARPVSAKDKRELFSEDTTTVLVFKDGAVIQLSAAIAVGQLLFLTDKRSKREVVCQVVHKKNHRPTSCYVEVEFTEEVENFWGVLFPDHQETPELPPTAEAVEAEEIIEDERSGPIAAPKTEDVAQLKGEVEALRAQLRELQGKQAAEEKKTSEDREEQARRLAEAEAAARAAAESEGRERAVRIDKEARENAKRLAERARQKFQDQQGQQGQETQPSPSGVSEEDRHLAEAEAAARAAAEEQARQKLLEKDEEARRAAEEARKWEQQAIENERERKRLERERKERELAGLPDPEPEQEKVPVREELGQAPRIGMKLPIGAANTPAEAANPVGVPAIPVAAATGRAEADTLDELLPKPALDFSHAPKGLDPNDPYNIYKPMRKKAGWTEIAAAGVLVLLLVGGGGFAWYKNWLPFLHHRVPDMPVLPKSAPVTKPAAPANVAKPAAPSVHPAGADATGAAPAGGAETPATAAANNSKPSSLAAKRDAVPAQPAEEKTAATRAPEKRAPTKKETPVKAAAGKLGKNHGKAETSSESKPKPTETVVAEDAPVIAAKLLHAVQPVYPPDAMRNYITGDVRIEAVVDPAGHIGAMQILVGPPALKQAAMDALKQYEYAPATQGGKAVASKVVVTVKFWFDP